MNYTLLNRYFVPMNIKLIYIQDADFFQDLIPKIDYGSSNSTPKDLCLTAVNSSGLM